MIRIDKKYAIIFIDYEGESLEDKYCYAPELITDTYYDDMYFNTNMQWNMYLIVPPSLFKNKAEKELFMNNDKYTRKYIIPKKQINSFINKIFPDIKEGQKVGEMYLVSGEDRYEHITAAQKLASKLYIKNNNKDLYPRIESYHREYNMLKTLSKLDKLRANMILLKQNYIYHTHINAEISIVKKKMSNFLKIEINE